MKSQAKLQELLHLARCWGDEPTDALAREIEGERKRVTPPQDLLVTLATLRREWTKAAVSQKRNRHIFFLGSVYEQVCEARKRCRLKGQDGLLTELQEHFDVHPDRNIFQGLLIVTCGDQIDRKVRSRWAACLRAVERCKTPPKMGAAQILRLGGISRCSSQ
jgi:hypothetical protein